MSQESSSTQLCEVLIDCYRDKDNNKSGETGDLRTHGEYGNNESDEDPLHSELGAPFRLLRRPTSKPNEALFQFGKAKKTSFDFTGRGKGFVGAGRGDAGDKPRVGTQEVGGVEGSGSGNLPATGILRMKETSSSPKITSDENRRKSLSNLSVETKKASQDEGSACSQKDESVHDAVASHKPMGSQRLSSLGIYDGTNSNNQVSFDDDYKGMTRPLEDLEKSVYFESLSQPRRKASDEIIGKPVWPQTVQSQRFPATSIVQGAEKHQGVTEAESELENLKKKPKQPQKPASESILSQYPNFSLLAARLKTVSKPTRRDKKNEKAPSVQPDKVLASQKPVRVTKSKIKNMSSQLHMKRHRYNDKIPPMSGLHEAINSVIREAYAEELNTFTIEREHFTAQITALKAINSDLSSDLHRANERNQQSTEGLQRIKENVSARNLQIKQLKNFADEMKSDLMQNKDAVKEINNLHSDTKKELKNALSIQESFSQISKKTSSSISELKESANQLIAVKTKNEHLYEQIEEKNRLLDDERKYRVELDENLQHAMSQLGGVEEINTQITNLSRRLEEMHGGLTNTSSISNTEDSLKTCLQAIKCLQEQQNFHSGYIMHAGAELQSLSRSVPAEFQRLEMVIHNGPWNSYLVGKLEEDMSELKAKVTSLAPTNEQITASNEARYSLQQQCSEKEIEIANLQTTIQSQNAKCQLADDKVQSLETKIASNKQLIEQNDLKVSRLKEVEASNMSLQHELKAAVEEQTRLAVNIRDKCFAEADQRGELDRLQVEKRLLEERVAGLDREKLLVEAKSKENFSKEKEEYEVGLQRLVADKILVLEKKLSDSKQDGGKLQLALDSTCKELVDLKSKNEELNIKLQSKEDTVEELVADLHAKISVSDNDAAKLGFPADELQEKNEAIEKLSNSKEKAEAEAQILGEELQASKQRLLEEQCAKEKSASELARLKKANEALHALINKDQVYVKEGHRIQESGGNTEIHERQAGSQAMLQVLEHDYQHSQACFSISASKGITGYVAPQVDLVGQTCAITLQNQRSTDKMSANGVDDGVPTSGQWPVRNDEQPILLNANAADSVNRYQSVNSVQNSGEPGNDNEICPYFQSSGFTAGVLGTPSLFSLYTNKEHILPIQNNQKSAINENYGNTEAAIESGQQNEPDLVSEMDVTTFSDFKKMENTAAMPSSISDFSDLDITTPEDFSTRPGPASTHQRTETEVIHRPRSSNMSARRKPSRSSPSQRDSDVSSEHVRNVGPEDVFQIDKKRPNPNTASKIKPSIFKTRGEGRVLFQAGYYAGDDDFSGCENKKRSRLDKPPFLKNEFTNNRSSLPVLGAGPSQEASVNASGVGQGRISKSQPRIKRILNWASMYSNTQQQQQQQQQQKDLRASTTTTSALEQKMKKNKQRIIEKKRNSSSNRRQTQAPSKCLIQPKKKSSVERNEHGKILVEKSLTPDGAKAPLSLAKFERLQQSCSTHVSGTPGRLDRNGGAVTGHAKRRRISKNNRYSFRFSQETLTR